MNKEHNISNARVSHPRLTEGVWLAQRADAPEGSSIATVAAAFAMAAGDFAFDHPDCCVSREKGQLVPRLKVPCALLPKDLAFLECP